MKDFFIDNENWIIYGGGALVGVIVFIILILVFKPAKKQIEKLKFKYPKPDPKKAAAIQKRMIGQAEKVKDKMVIYEFSMNGIPMYIGKTNDPVGRIKEHSGYADLGNRGCIPVKKMIAGGAPMKLKYITSRPKKSKVNMRKIEHKYIKKRKPHYNMLLNIKEEILLFSQSHDELKRFFKYSWKVRSMKNSLRRRPHKTKKLRIHILKKYGVAIPNRRALFLAKFIVKKL